MNGTLSINEKCEKVLNLHSATADEVAEEIGENILAVRPTICMLFKNGIVVKTGAKRKNTTGKSAHVWAMKKSGIDIGTDAVTVPPVTLALVKQAKQLCFTQEEIRTMLSPETPNEILTMAIKQIYS
jgi:predicted ArsR family transcriptional regulator